MFGKVFFLLFAIIFVYSSNVDAQKKKEVLCFNEHKAEKRHRRRNSKFAPIGEAKLIPTVNNREPNRGCVWLYVCQYFYKL